MAEIKKEFKNFLDDLDKNVKNKEDLDYVKNRTALFMNSVLDYVDYIVKYKENKITEIEKIQSELERKMNGIEHDIAEIQQDIYFDDFEDMSPEEIEEMNEMYDDEEYDTQIVCPYCENEFLVDLSQELNEIQCPECNNIIELDWTGNVEEEPQSNHNCGAGHCSQCPGCGSNKKEDDDM